MNWSRNLKIGTKLALGFGSLAILMIVLGIFSIVQMSNVNASTVDIATNWLPSVKVLGEIRFITASSRRLELRDLLHTDKNALEGDEADIKKQEALLADAEKRYEATISSPEERKLYDDFHLLWDKETETLARVLELSRTNKKADAIELSLSTGVAAFNAAEDKLQEDHG